MRIAEIHNLPKIMLDFMLKALYNKITVKNKPKYERKDTHVEQIFSGRTADYRS